MRTVLLSGLCLLAAALVPAGGHCAPQPQSQPPAAALGPGPAGIWSGIDGLPVLRGEPVKMANALWGETPKNRQLMGRKVTLADIKGPAIITMIHFAMPESLKLDRSSVLRIWWDDEKNPSVDVPLVDFFCDPNGTQERVDSILVNKRRGWNAYFPMPFRKRAHIELIHDGVGPASCYFYCFYRPLKHWDPRLLYFHAYWHQAALLLGRQDYRALDARGRGQFIGWNITVRGLPPNDGGYPVDENAKFYVDGEKRPSIELMGLEDSFGFSFGFPKTGNDFPYTGYAPYYKGAAAYRFFVHEAITFRKSLRVAIGFGEHEAPIFRQIYSKPQYPLEFSSCCYWYQTQPHLAYPPMPSYRMRLPTPDSDQLKAIMARSAAARAAGLAMQCFLGDPKGEDEWIAPHYDCILDRGYRFNDTQNLWANSPVKHCWASWDYLKMTLIMPRGVSGQLRLQFVDGDNFGGGRREHVYVGSHDLGIISDFTKGKWVDVNLTSADTRTGKVQIRIDNAREGSNVVISTVEFKPAKG